MRVFYCVRIVAKERFCKVGTSFSPAIISLSPICACFLPLRLLILKYFGVLAPSVGEYANYIVAEKNGASCFF